MVKDPGVLPLRVYKKLIGEGSVVVDCRNKDQFTAGFIPGSIFLGVEHGNEKWAERLIPKEEPLLLLAPEGEEEKTATSLIKTGFSEVRGALKGGFPAWKAAGEPIDMLIEIDSDELALDIPFDDDLLVVDVRESDEFDKTHIRKAVHLPLSEMTDVMHIASLDEGANIYVHDDKVYESLIAASLLKRHGYERVRIIADPWEKIRKNSKIDKAKKPADSTK